MLSCFDHCLFAYSNQSEFHSFVSGINAGGGGDAPEDIMGGLKAVFTNLSWRSGGSRVSWIVYKSEVVYTCSYTI